MAAGDYAPEMPIPRAAPPVMLQEGEYNAPPVAPPPGAVGAVEYKVPSESDELVPNRSEDTDDEDLKKDTRKWA